jgi:hypothetical protein
MCGCATRIVVARSTKRYSCHNHSLLEVVVAAAAVDLLKTQGLTSTCRIQLVVAVADTELRPIVVVVVANVRALS